MALAQTKPVALLVHGWKDDPCSGWLGWLAGQLEVRGFEVLAPQFDSNAKPLIGNWQKLLLRTAVGLDDRSLIIAHSLGCFLTLRLLEQIESTTTIDKVILVSGFYDAPRESANRFFKPEPKWSKIRSSAREFVCIYSDDDKVVSADRTRRLADNLSAELVMVPGRGHFLGSRGMSTFPELLKLIDS